MTPFIYEMLTIGKSIEMKNRLVVAKTYKAEGAEQQQIGFPSELIKIS